MSQQYIEREGLHAMTGLRVASPRMPAWNLWEQSAMPVPVADPSWRTIAQTARVYIIELPSSTRSVRLL